MAALRTETLPIASEMDIVQARQTVRSWASEAGFRLVDVTKMVTAASELARNTLVYGGGGAMALALLQEGIRTGIRLTFEDHGPGIADLQQALQDGFTTGTGLGMGLGGAKRLMNDFHIESRPGEGTKVTIARWK